MNRKRLSVEQIVAVLKQAELGMALSDVIRPMGISAQNFYCRKKQYAGLQSDQVRELEQLQDENVRLKYLVAELSLDKAILQDINSKNGPALVEASSDEPRRGSLSDEPTQGLSSR